MATVFEIFAYGEKRNDAGHAAAAAFDEIDQLEQKLSYFIDSSEVSQVNRLREGQSVLVSAATMHCLSLARRVHDETGGAFDPTAGSLLTGRRPWDEHEDLPRGSAPPPRTGDVVVGMDLFALDPAARTVTALADGVQIDLGAVGKGFAVDAAARVLKDWDVHTAMIVAGQSSMLPLGTRPGHDGWTMRLRDPRDETTVVRRLRLGGAALGTSSVVGEPHVLDPRTGLPVGTAIGAWAVAPTAAESDALSTAFLVMTADEMQAYCRRRRDVVGLTFAPDGTLTEAGDVAALGTDHEAVGRLHNGT